MTDERTARLSLPLLQAGQMKKELFHNEALALLDLATQPVVTAIGLTDPPAAPLVGQAWIVGAAPTGAWAGHTGALAGWTQGGWRFVAPFAGLQAWHLAEGRVARFDGAQWRVGAAIPAPAGGATIDAEARAAISALLAILRTHGLIAA